MTYDEAENNDDGHYDDDDYDDADLGYDVGNGHANACDFVDLTLGKPKDRI